ncbi:divalent-cation tolerance protein CutA [Chloroflexota bacterium]
MPEDTAYLIILVTTGSSQEANNIAQELLQRKKAACVNIVPGVQSLFRWQDKVDSASEHLLIIKTRAALLDEVVALISQVHSYDVPEIIALPIIGGSRDYLEWVGEQVK